MRSSAEVGFFQGGGRPLGGSTHADLITRAADGVEVLSPGVSDPK